MVQLETKLALRRVVRPGTGLRSRPEHSDILRTLPWLTPDFAKRFMSGPGPPRIEKCTPVRDSELSTGWESVEWRNRHHMLIYGCAARPHTRPTVTIPPEPHGMIFVSFPSPSN